MTSTVTFRPRSDETVRRLLRIPDQPPVHRPDVHRGFSTSVLISAVRCTLTYVVLPFLTPVIGLLADVGPWIGLPLSMVAVVANIVSIRRFWTVNHPRRWVYTGICSGVMMLVTVLAVTDLRDILA